MFIPLRPICRAGPNLAHPAEDLPFPLTLVRGERLRYFARARYALLAAARQLGWNQGDNVLVPAYLCAVAVDPFRAAGLEVRFYRVGSDLAADPGDILARRDGRTRGVLLVHYFGWPQPGAAVQEIRRAGGLAIIEDCAHAFLSRRGDEPLGTLGDVSVFSFWKTAGTPLGAALVSNRPDLSLRPAPAAVDWVDALRAGLVKALDAAEFAAGVSPRFMLARRLRGLPALRRRRSRFIAGAGAMPSAWLRALHGADYLSAARQRVENFHRLRSHLDSPSARRAGLRPLFDALPPGAVPLVFPLLAAHPDALRAALLDRGIQTVRMWHPLPRAVTGAEFPEACGVAQRLLAVPIHQDLRPAHIDRIARELLARHQT